MATEDEDLARYQKRIGTTLRGKWKIDALLGVGGMAAVYSATHKIGRRDAIKILHPEVAVSRELRARFEQEALAVGKLGHPAAVTVIDIDATEEGAPFLVMEHLDGENLGQLAYRRGGLPADELFRYAEAVLDVLQVAHDQGIVHRDIKPDNLFVTREGNVKLLDFGIARMRQGVKGLKTRTGAMLGTTSYMAPEQIHGRDIDGRADLYALGATLFRIIAKRKLHEATSEAELLMKMGTTQAPQLAEVAPGVDARVARVVDLALAFDADRRYPDAKTMRADVLAVLEGQEPPFARARASHAQNATRAEGLAAPVLAAVAVGFSEPTAPTRAPESMAAAAAISAAMPAPAVSMAAVSARSGAGPTFPATFPALIEASSAPSMQRERPTWLLPVVMGVSMLMAGLALGLFFLWNGHQSADEARAGERDTNGETSGEQKQSKAQHEEDLSAPSSDSNGLASADAIEPGSSDGEPDPRPGLRTPETPPRARPPLLPTTTAEPVAGATGGQANGNASSGSAKGNGKGNGKGDKKKDKKKHD